MYLGIDLATTNCGLCWMDNDLTCTFNTFGITDISSDESILKFAEALSKVVSDQICFVDFHFNECFLPNKKKHIAIKYYLAGVIWLSAKEVHFIKPSEVRQHFGHPAKMKKYQFHEAMFLGEDLKQETEHERDAYLLALMGKQLKDLKP